MANKKLKTVIIRLSAGINESVGGDDPFAAPDLIGKALKEAGGSEGLSLTIDEMSVDEIESISRENGVVSAVPEMPFVQIKPNNIAAALPAIGVSNWGIGAIGAEGWDETIGSEAIVAVLDTGIDKNHAAFAGMQLITKNFTQDVDEDTDGHGTHCAGTIFGRDVDGARIGVARGVQKAIIGKVLSAQGGSTQTIYDGLNWAVSQQAHVISMSLGIDFPQFREDLKDRGYVDLEATAIALSAYRENIRLFDALVDAYNKGAGAVRTPLLIGAAGNESNRPNYTIATSPPAAADGLISVGALDQNKDPAFFSNTDPDLSAPGVDIISAKAGGGLISMSGTSMAAPHVAGIAAGIVDFRLKAGETVNPRKVSFELMKAIEKLPHSRKAVGEGLAKATTGL